MDTLNDLNERVDAFVGTSSFDTPAAANDQAPIDVPAEVHEDIVASVDFSEVELADEFTEPQVAVTPNGLLPMEPLPIRRTSAQGCSSHARRDRGGQRLHALRPPHQVAHLHYRCRGYPQLQRRCRFCGLPFHAAARHYASAADRRRVPGLCRRGRRNYDR